MQRNRSERLKSIVKLAKHEEDVAVVELVKIKKILADNKTRYDELDEYRRQYFDKHNLESASGTDVSSLINFKNFMAKLDNVIAQQNKNVESCLASLDAIEKVWIEKHVYYKKMDDIFNKALDSEKTTRNKKDQKESDDISQTLYQRKR